MGTVLDTTIFIDLERAIRSRPTVAAIAGLTDSLAAQLGEDEELAIASITASELLHGVHRATDEHRARREAFVEGVLAAFPTLPFDLLTARVHARLWASLVSAGSDVGAHDRLVAAGAMAVGWRVATANKRHFYRVPGLTVEHVRLVRS